MEEMLKEILENGGVCPHLGEDHKGDESGIYCHYYGGRRNLRKCERSGCPWLRHRRERGNE